MKKLTSVLALAGLLSLVPNFSRAQDAQNQSKEEMSFVGGIHTPESDGLKERYSNLWSAGLGFYSPLGNGFKFSAKALYSWNNEGKIKETVSTSQGTVVNDVETEVSNMSLLVGAEKYFSSSTKGGGFYIGANVLLSRLNEKGKRVLTESWRTDGRSTVEDLSVTETNFGGGAYLGLRLPLSDNTFFFGEAGLTTTSDKLGGFNGLIGVGGSLTK